ncbi:hypothetical protein [Sulfurimonas sp.]|jgi:hypothetical protein|uniref:hypothetical protein n=1 Tax=Sulfurimonas sp. TaxID=2022749 RepID=UPI0025CCCCCB|nr:hypothetical protein [Sulfurimonas sp.]MCK9474272.1 hypothetical protein [Sulfurimonas sp.]
MENSLDKPSEKQGLSKRKEKKKRWWKEKANREKNNKELKKAKDLRDELLKLQEHMHSMYHNN